MDNLETFVANSDNYMVTVFKSNPHIYFVRLICTDNEGNLISFQRKAERIQEIVNKIVGWNNLTFVDTQLWWEVPCMENKVLGDILGKFCCVLSCLLREGDENARGIATVHIDFTIPLKLRA